MYFFHVLHTVYINFGYVPVTSEREEAGCILKGEGGGKMSA